MAMSIEQALAIDQEDQKWRAYEEWLRSQRGTGSYGGARQSPNVSFRPEDKIQPTTPRPSGEDFQAAQNMLQGAGLIEGNRGMLGTLGSGLKGIAPEIGQVGTKFVLPAVAGYYGSNALMGTGPFGQAAGASTISGGSGTTTLAGGAGADTLGAGSSTVFGGTTGGAAATSPFGGSAVGAPTVFGGSAGTSAGVNPFAAMVGPGTVAGAPSATSTAGGGGMFSWLTADKAKTAGKALLGSGGIIPALGGYLSSRDAANTAERGTSEGARMADPFAAERPQYADALRRMMTDPNSFAGDPSYQFRVGQGQQALERSNAAKGYLGSGNMNLDLTKYGQDMGSQEYQNQYARLAQLSGANTGSPATAGQVYGQGMQNVANQNQQTSGSLGNVARSVYDNWPALQKTFGSSA